MPSLKHNSVLKFKRRINRPHSLYYQFVRKLVFYIVDQITRNKVGYVAYQGFSAEEKKRFHRRLHMIIRKTFFGEQTQFFIALSQQLLDDRLQYRIGIIGSPLYDWCLVKLFNNQPVAMLHYLQKVRMHNPIVPKVVKTW